LNIRRPVLRCALLVLLTASRVWAVDPSRHISQYAHTSWRSQDGFFGALPRAITQTADGYLWIATDNGLLRFDGVRFVPWTPPAGQQLPSSAIYALLAARDGGLWIGTEAGLSHWTGSDLVNYPDAEAVAAIIEDRHGTVWTARVTRSNRETRALCQVVGAAMRCHGPADGLPMPFGTALAEDKRGGVWIGGNTGLMHGAPGSFVPYGPPGLVSNRGLGGVIGLAPIGDGAMWVGMNVSGPGLGLQQLVDGAWRPFVTPTIDGSALQVLCLFMDRQGALWVGTYQGLYRIYGDTVDHFVAADGLSSDVVTNVFEDREGNIWVATSGGLDCFRNVRVVTLSNDAGFRPNEVNSVFASREGTVWVAALNALASVRQGRVTPLRQGQGLPGSTVTTMFQDHAGQLWVGIDRTLSIYEHGRFTPVNDRDGRPLGLIVGMRQGYQRPDCERGHSQERAPGLVLGRTRRSVAADACGVSGLTMSRGGHARKRARHQEGTYEHSLDTSRT
jgi:ligand-binding sensor domain-containing protein